MRCQHYRLSSLEWRIRTGWCSVDAASPDHILKVAQGVGGWRWLKVVCPLMRPAHCHLPKLPLTIRSTHWNYATSGTNFWLCPSPLSPLNCYWTYWLSLYFTHCKLSRSCFARRKSSLWLKPNAANAVNCVAEMKRFARFNVSSLNAIFMWSCIPSNVDLQVFHDKKYGTPLVVLEPGFNNITTYINNLFTNGHDMLTLLTVYMCVPGLSFVELWFS